MLGPKEVHMMLVDEACVEFEEKHGRAPTKKEEDQISMDAMGEIGNYYAAIGDAERSRRKDAQ